MKQTRLNIVTKTEKYPIIIDQIINEYSNIDVIEVE